MKERETTDRHRWIGRPGVARAVRLLVYVTPFLASILAAFALSSLIPPAATWPIAVIRLIAIAACSTVVLYGVDRGTRKALPLAILLDLTLVFPDEAPSRFRVALRSGGTRTLEQRLSEYRQLGHDEPAAAAEQLLELVAELSRHDRRTRGHSERVRAYAHMIGDELGLNAEQVDKLQWAALLHDIGKLEIPYEILNKPGRLDRDEFEVIKTHPAIGALLTAPLEGWLGDWVHAVGQHHERWDGGGYPAGLSGQNIALAARIVSVADSFDVMTSVRSYQTARPAADARQELADCAGSQFDPAIVRAFLSISLGKLRMAMGPLSWLTNLWLFPPGIVSAGAAPAMTAIAGFSAAALGVGVSAEAFVAEPAPYIAQSDALESPPSLDDEATTTTVILTPAAVTDPGAGSNEARSGVVSQGLEVSTEVEAVNETVASTTTSSTIAHVLSGGTVSAAPTTTKPGLPTTTATTVVISPRTATTTTAPRATPPTATTVMPPRATPSTTVAVIATTTTVRPATTAAPTTTVPTTTVPTTTTTTAPVVPQGYTYLLGSSGPGDVASQAILPLVRRTPLNAVLPNLGTDRDNKPGLEIHRDGVFEVTKHENRLQRFLLDPSTPLALQGRATASFWLAAKNLKDDEVQAAAALMSCPDQPGACTMLASALVDFRAVENQFDLYTFDFGTLNQTIPQSSNLQLWVIATKDSKHDMFIAFDTVGYESALTIVH